MKHKLELIAHDEDGAEWQCPECGRHMRLTVADGLSIIEPGNQTVNHGSASTSAFLRFGADVKPVDVH